MSLSFLGNGSAFNTKLGNNCAFWKDGETLLLIDCGSNIFDRMMSINFLDGVKYIEVLVTHTHPDHIGSLGDLIFYAHFIMKVQVVVSSPDSGLFGLLSCMGVKPQHYEFRWMQEGFIYQLKYYDFAVTPIETKHDKDMKCYGYMFDNAELDSKFYYSGDSYWIPPIVLSDLFKHRLDALYQDTSFAHYDGNVHLSLRNLQLIPKEYRRYVWCMHLDKSFDRKVAEEYGFNVTSNIFEQSIHSPNFQY